MAQRSPDSLAPMVTLLAFSVTVVALGLMRPLARPSEQDRVAFELGYYGRACGFLANAGDESLVLTDIRSLSRRLKISDQVDESCPSVKWFQAVKEALAPSLFGSFWLGLSAADLELGRMWRPDPSDRVSATKLRSVADRLYPASTGAAVSRFAAGEFSATALHRQLYRSATALRHQLDAETPRRLFALGYHLARCLDRDDDNPIGSVAVLLNHLAIPTEAMPRDPNRIKREICTDLNAGDRILKRFGPWIGGFFLFGRTVAAVEEFRREHAEEAVRELRPVVVDVARRLSPDAHAEDAESFADGRFSANDLYRRLFGDKEALVASGQ
jgi:hypothetical protein